MSIEFSFLCSLIYFPLEPEGSQVPAKVNGVRGSHSGSQRALLRGCTIDLPVELYLAVVSIDGSNGAAHD